MPETDGFGQVKILDMTWKTMQLEMPESDG
jgi:hypothetical protein